MTPVNECPHSDALTPETCTLCKTSRARPRPAALRPVGSVRASFPGHCESCNLSIIEGQLICIGSTGWVHTACFDG